jgi:hypothetical protein
MVKNSLKLKFSKLNDCESSLAHQVKQVYISHYDVVHQYEIFFRMVSNIRNTNDF